MAAIGSCSISAESIAISVIKILVVVQNRFFMANSSMGSSVKDEVGKRSGSSIMARR